MSSPGALEAQWQSAITTAIKLGVSGLPLTAIKGVRVYHHYFYLNLLQ